MPRLIQTETPFEPSLFKFCFRIAANHWEDISPEMRQMLIEAAGIDPALVAELIAEEGFAIEMFKTPDG